MAQQDIPEYDGDDSFQLGMNGYLLPGKLDPGEYVDSMNTICRGGISQTRPGSRSLPFEVPGTNLQGLTMFRPTGSSPQLVFASDGNIYVSPFPFNSYYQLTALKFSKYTKFISWAACVQSSYYNSIGEFQWLDSPRNVLVMQDGSTRAAFWDGATARHLNPTQSTTGVTQDGLDETPLGLWMRWSNNRLWVSRRDRVFASDLGNPLKFTETQYLNEARAFYLPGACTGIVETSDRQGIICFTSTTGTFLQSSIQDRTLWLSTPSFQQTILPNIGCVAPRSIVQQYGLIWWWTQSGVVNQNNALQLNITSRMDLQDNEMIQSKANLSFDLTGVCGASNENFLFHAVPNGDKINTRLHVLDQAPFENNLNTWPSYWTGWRPVEFATGIINSQGAVYALSYDFDGVNRIWELFREERSDNGIPITSYVVTKSHFFGNRDYKDFRYAEIELVNVLGDTSIMVAAAGQRGTFQTLMRKDMVATNGQVYFDSLYGTGGAVIAGSMPQTRILRTAENLAASDCNSACVESSFIGLTDKEFSILIAWSGHAGVKAYRIFAKPNPQGYDGICEESEVGQVRLLTTDGCAARDAFSDSSPFETFSASCEFSKVDPTTGDNVTFTSIQSSVISQQDAKNKAAATARWFVLSQIGELV